MEDSNKEWADDVDEAESEPSLMINLYFKFCRPNYNVQLESIAVNGQVLSIDFAVFFVAKNPWGLHGLGFFVAKNPWGLHGLGTFLNSGITLAFLPPIAYDILINSVSFSYSFLAFEICLRVIISIYILMTWVNRIEL